MRGVGHGHRDDPRLRHQPWRVLEIEHAETDAGLEAERLRSGKGLTGLATGASQASERELMDLDVPCANQAPALVRAALSEMKYLDALRDDVILVASELAHPCPAFEPTDLST